MFVVAETHSANASPPANATRLNSLSVLMQDAADAHRN